MNNLDHIEIVNLLLQLSVMILAALATFRELSEVGETPEANQRPR